MRSKYHSVNNLKVSEELLLFVNNELFNGTDISPEKFWEDFDKAVHEPVSYTHLTLPTKA